ncbi:MAG: hypothetical protein ACLSVD_13345 [Eggerthellaceae bacterium]
MTEGIRPDGGQLSPARGLRCARGHHRRHVDGSAPDYLEEEGILDGDEPGKQKTGFAGGRGRGLYGTSCRPRRRLPEAA